MQPDEEFMWGRVQELFGLAVELEESKRLDFVREQCGDDELLYSEVATLVKAFDTAAEELDRPWVTIAHDDNADDESDLLIPPDAIPGYVLHGEIHRGGQGVVYRATQLGTRRDVAIKFLLTGPFASIATRQRFHREVELMAMLRHPGIVPIFDSGEVHGHPYFVMELVEGLDLNCWRSESNVSVEQKLHLMVLICEAVGAAHQKGIVHRDLKPSNILVTADNQTRILDFGIAKATSDNRSSDKVSLTGTILGTLNYMSPEQAAGNIVAIDASTDVYGLSVILFELLSGKFPYSMDGSLGQNLLTIQQQPPLDLTSIDEKLDQRLAAILAKGLSKEQGRRYHDANALGDDLKRFLADEEIDARPLCVSASKTRWTRGFPSILLLISGLLAAAAIGWWVQPWRGDPPPIAEPLKPLDDGQKYSRAELDTQIDAIRDMIRFQHPPKEILRQFFTRFQDLAEEDFEAELSD